jgi:hypothetical protein
MSQSSRSLVALAAAVAALVGVAGVVATDPTVADDAPSREETIREARERGIEGTITVPDRATIDENAEPIRHGPFLLLPYGWEGPEKDEYHPIDNPTPKGPPALTTDETRSSPLWRDPAYIPAGFEFERADSEDINRHVRLLYKSPQDYLEIQVSYPQGLPLLAWYSPVTDGPITEAIEAEGLPAVLWHDPDGQSGTGISLYTYREDTNTAYVVQSSAALAVEEVSRVLAGLR